MQQQSAPVHHTFTRPIAMANDEDDTQVGKYTVHGFKYMHTQHTATNAAAQSGKGMKSQLTLSFIAGERYKRPAINFRFVDVVVIAYYLVHG